jgi:secernin
MCDCLCALGPATASGVTLFAKNSDRPPDEAQRLEWFAPRAGGRRTRTTHIEIEDAPGETIGFVGSRPAWAWGIEHGVNEAGVAIGNETIFTTLDPRAAPAGLIGIDLVRIGLERGPSAAAAVDVLTAMLERHGQGGSGHRDADRPYWSSFLVADAARAFVLETSGITWAVEEVERSRAISNRTTIAAFDAAHRHPRQPVTTLVDPRLRASRAVLACEPVTVAALEAHLRAHVGGANGWTVCMHVGGLESTTAAVVAELAPNTRHPKARFLLGAPCRSLFVPVFVGQPLDDPPAWEDFAVFTTHDRPRLDALEAELEADAVDEPGWNAAAWRRVRAEVAMARAIAPRE